MKFKIELKNIENLFIEKGKIHTNKNGKKIEYIIENNVITDVNPYDEDRVANEKIHDLLENDERVKRINNIIQKMENKSFVNHCLNKYDGTSSNTTEKPTPNTDIEKVKQIISLDKIGILDEIAEKNRENINDSITSEETPYIPQKLNSKDEQIAKLKEIIEKLENES